jgi:hypothetical protein
MLTVSFSLILILYLPIQAHCKKSLPLLSADGDLSLESCYPR